MKKTVFRLSALAICMCIMLMQQSCTEEDSNDILSAESEITLKAYDAKASQEITGAISQATIKRKEFTPQTTYDIVDGMCTDGLLPSSLTADLGIGDSVTEDKTGCVNPAPPLGDIIFSMDVSGSLAGELENLKVNSVNIMNSIRANIPDTQFGLVSHSDYTGSYTSCGYSSSYGINASGDYPYLLNQELSSDIMIVDNAISALTLKNGGDSAESYARVLYETLADENIIWRDGAAKVVVAMLDNIPHDCALPDPLSGVTSGVDPGRDGIAGTADDIDIDDVILDLIDNNVTLIVLSSGAPYVTQLWQNYASQTGGTAYQINADGTIPGDVAIEDLITDLVLESVGTIGNLTLQTNPASYASWLTNVDPASYTSITLDEAQEFEFDIEITVPDGTADGLHEFDIELVGDGVIYGRQDVSINVFADTDDDGCIDSEDPHPDSNTDPTINLDGCDSLVENQFIEECTTMMDLILDCLEGAENHGDFVSCVAHLTNSWKNDGLISGNEKGAIQSCAAQADLP